MAIEKVGARADFYCLTCRFAEMRLKLNVSFQFFIYQIAFKRLSWRGKPFFYNNFYCQMQD